MIFIQLRPFLIIFIILSAIYGYNLSVYGSIEDNQADPRFPIGDPIPAPRNPFGANEGPPQIVMIYNGTEHYGNLAGAISESGDVNDDLPRIDDPRSNITTLLPEQIVNVAAGSKVTFEIRGNPQPEIQPNSISVTAYDRQNVSRSMILTLEQEDKQDTFTVDLTPGKYIFLAVGVWLPDLEDDDTYGDEYIRTGGYVEYTFLVDVR